MSGDVVVSGDVVATRGVVAPGHAAASGDDAVSWDWDAIVAGGGESARACSLLGLGSSMWMQSSVQAPRHNQGKYYVCPKLSPVLV